MSDLIMVWDATRYPAPMDELSPVLRARAIELANALLETGFDEQKATRLAVAVIKALANGQPPEPSRPH